MDRGSFSAAAADLGLTPSAVSKLMSRLEDRLGARLLQRTTRRLALTAEGETFLARARRIVADIEEAEAEVMRVRGAPRGTLRIPARAPVAVRDGQGGRTGSTICPGAIGERPVRGIPLDRPR